MTTSDIQSVETSGPEETFGVAEDLGRHIAGSRTDGSPVPVIMLNGELGAGKTVYAKGLAAGLGVQNVDDVVSPTFTLVNEHMLPGGGAFHHVDLYRIAHPDDCEGIGLREILGRDDSGAVAVEWAEKVADSAWDLTRHPVWYRVTIEDLGDDRRTIIIEKIPSKPSS